MNAVHGIWMDFDQRFCQLFAAQFESLKVFFSSLFFHHEQNESYSFYMSSFLAEFAIFTATPLKFIIISLDFLTLAIFTRVNDATF